VANEFYIITLAASNRKRNVTVCRPSLRLSVCDVGAYSARLIRGDNATRPAYISVRVLLGTNCIN